jgi:putative hemolysin
MTINLHQNGFHLSLANSQNDIWAAQELRYSVFVEELGAQGAGVDHDARRECDHFDAFADHLLLRYQDRPVGVYRLMRADQAERAGGFYTESEFDVTPLQTSGRRLLELGRSCVQASFRTGPAVFLLWQGLAEYVRQHACEVLFGTASFHGTDPQSHAAALSLLHHGYLADPELRPKARPLQPMNLIPPTQLDRRSAMVHMPPLIKAYLRLGSKIGEGAFIDHDFDCIDVCMIMDTKKLNEKTTARYQRATS